MKLLSLSWLLEGLSLAELWEVYLLKDTSFYP